MPNVPIQAVRVGERHRKDLGNLRELAQSIKEIGLLQPILLDRNYQLIAGQRRLEAVKTLGREEIAANIAETLFDATAMLKAERHENIYRKAMTPSELVASGEAIEKLSKPRAKERQQLHGGTAPGRSNDSPGTRTMTVVSEVGEALGVSGSTYARARNLVRAAREGDVIAAAAVEQMDETGRVTPAYNKWKGRPTAPSGRGNRPETSDHEDDPFWIPKLGASNLKSQKQRIFLIRHYAATGSTSEQMSPLVGVKPETVRVIAREKNISIPGDEVFGRNKRLIDPLRVVRETVRVLSNATAGLGLIDYDKIDRPSALQWLEPLEDSMKQISAFVRKIKEIAQ
jgi:ParB family chromosome partitioning protein